MMPADDLSAIHTVLREHSAAIAALSARMDASHLERMAIKESAEEHFKDIDQKLDKLISHDTREIARAATWSTFRGWLWAVFGAIGVTGIFSLWDRIFGGSAQ